jgi:voltage-gated potassium channel
MSQRWWSALRALGTTAALVAIYYLLPLDRTSTWIAATILVIRLVALIALMPAIRPVAARAALG